MAGTRNCALHNGGGFWYKDCSYCSVSAVRGCGDDQMVFTGDWNSLSAVITNMADVLAHFAGLQL